jgi:hypothetical protein
MKNIHGGIRHAHLDRALRQGCGSTAAPMTRLARPMRPAALIEHRMTHWLARLHGRWRPEQA